MLRNWAFSSHLLKKAIRCLILSKPLSFSIFRRLPRSHISTEKPNGHIMFWYAKILNYPPKRLMVTLCFDTPLIACNPLQRLMVTLCLDMPRYRTIHRKGKWLHYTLNCRCFPYNSRESQWLQYVLMWQYSADFARMGGKIATGATWIPSTEGFMLYLWTGRPRQS